MSVAITLPYLWHMKQGSVRPHIFTWIIWALSSGTAAAAQLSSDAGPGAWAQAAGAASCVSIVVLSFSKGEHDITRTDILAFILALTAIPLWLVTAVPLYAVLIVTFIDLSAYYPTFRKAYRYPHHEAVYNYAISNLGKMLSLYAITDYSLTTVLFPAALFVANGALVAFLLWRRTCLPLRT